MVADCYGYGYTTMDEGGPCSFHLGGPQQFKYIQQHHLLFVVPFFENSFLSGC